MKFNKGELERARIKKTIEFDSAIVNFFTHILKDIQLFNY